jgi:hypothetical protein
MHTCRQIHLEGQLVGILCLEVVQGYHVHWDALSNVSRLLVCNCAVSIYAVTNVAHKSIGLGAYFYIKICTVCMYA